MSVQNPNEPVENESAEQMPLETAATPSESASRHILVIAFFLAVVLVIMGLQRWGGKLEQAEGEKGSMPLLFSGRYAMGVKSTGIDKTPTFGGGNNAAQLMDQIKTQAVSAADGICATVLIAELASAEDALQWLEEVAQSHQLSEALAGDAAVLRQIYTSGPDSVAADQKQQFIERQDWFGELAFVYGMDDQSPEREAVMKPAIRAFWSMIFIMVVLFGVACLGFLLFLVAAVLYSRGKIKIRYTEDVADITARRLPYLETMTFFLLFFFAISLILGALARFLPGWGGMALSGLGFILSLSCLGWLKFRGVSFADMSRAIGLHKGRGVFKEMLAGMGGYLAGVPIICMGFLITLILVKLTGEQPTHPIVEQFKQGGVIGLVLIFAIACIGAPVMEEIMFRGVLYHYARRSGSVLLSALSTGLVFAAIHPQGLAAIPVLASIGMVFALLREWRGSLIASITAHGCNNFLVMCLGLSMSL